MNKNFQKQKGFQEKKCHCSFRESRYIWRNCLWKIELENYEKMSKYNQIWFSLQYQYLDFLVTFLATHLFFMILLTYFIIQKCIQTNRFLSVYLKLKIVAVRWA